MRRRIRKTPNGKLYFPACEESLGKPLIVACGGGMSVLPSESGNADSDEPRCFVETNKQHDKRNKQNASQEERFQIPCNGISIQDSLARRLDRRHLRVVGKTAGNK